MKELKQKGKKLSSSKLKTKGMVKLGPNDVKSDRDGRKNKPYSSTIIK